MNSHNAPIIVLAVTGGILVAGLLLALRPESVSGSVKVTFENVATAITAPATPTKEPLFPGLE